MTNATDGNTGSVELGCPGTPTGNIFGIKYWYSGELFYKFSVTILEYSIVTPRKHQVGSPGVCSYVRKEQKGLQEGI